MNDLFLIASGAGLRDGLNPCIFMACAFFIIQGLWLNTVTGQLLGPRLGFVMAYALGTLIFNFGPAQIFTLQNNFISIAKILYFILGAAAFVTGVVFFKDWILNGYGQTLAGKPAEKTKTLSLAGRLSVNLASIAIAVGLSSLSSLWPINNYIVILGNEAIAKGQWQRVMPMLLPYIIVSMWALWILWAFLSIKNLRPSLLKIVCAAVFFTASSCMILIFK